LLDRLLVLDFDLFRCTLTTPMHKGAKDQERRDSGQQKGKHCSWDCER
jgi:hypothetical protein